MMGLIVPGGWEEFFRHIGDPYSGPMWPLEDDRNFFEVLLPRLKSASEQFDMIPCPQHKSFDPQAWCHTDNHLPGDLEPYFLKSNAGPAYVLGGMVCRPLITTAESNGKFTIGLIEGSSHHDGHGIFYKTDQQIFFEEVHHAFYVAEGKVDFGIEGSAAQAHAGELVYVPRDTMFRFDILSRFAKIYAFCNGAGIIEVLKQGGEDYSLPILPEKASVWDVSKFDALESSIGGGLQFF